jgi:putative peptidoglycan lipid II flippase
MLAVVSIAVLLGIALAEPIVTVLTPGFVDDAAKVLNGQLTVNRFDLTVQGVRIIFPMTGLLVLSAWALAILNSHRRFLLPYFAPVLWNVAIIGALFGAAFMMMDDPLAIQDSMPVDTLTRLLFASFFGALVGGGLQFAVQLPLVFRELTGFRFSLSTKVEGVREALKAFGPVVAGRGAYQISTWIDMILASIIAAGAVGALGFAQVLYVLPISLFGMSVAASELPELSRIDEDQRAAFLARIQGSLRQIMFLTVPTFVGYLIFGLPLIRGLFERGEFGYNDSWLIYAILGGYTIGLLATTASRLLQNVFYAVQDTKTPAKIAVLRVVIATVIAVPLMFYLDQFGVAAFIGTTPQEQPLFFGAVGLAVGASLGAWIELWRLGAVLRRRIGFRMPWRDALPMVGVAILSAGPAAVLWWFLPEWSTLIVAVLVVGSYGVTYLVLAHLFNFDEMDVWAGRLLRPFRKRKEEG